MKKKLPLKIINFQIRKLSWFLLRPFWIEHATHVGHIKNLNSPFIALTCIFRPLQLPSIWRRILRSRFRTGEAGTRAGTGLVWWREIILRFWFWCFFTSAHSCFRNYETLKYILYDCKNTITLMQFRQLALEGTSRPSSKLIVNMFSLCTS